MTREEERALMTRVQKGDSAAFETVVRENEAFVYRLALQKLGNREDAEDAAQEVFLKAYTSIGAFRCDCKLSVWLYRITGSVCVDMLRRRKDAVSLSPSEEGEPVPEIPDERFDPVELAERRELREQVGAALERLPEDAREILVLRELGGQSYEEIAATLSLDPGTVKSRLFRARKKLCAILSGNFSESDASKERKGGTRT